MTKNFLKREIKIPRYILKHYSLKKEIDAKEILEFVDDAVVVGCKRGSLQIGTIQPPSKKPMSAKAYCVGRGKRVGDSIV